MTYTGYNDLFEIGSKYGEIDSAKINWIDLKHEEAEIFYAIHNSSEFISKQCRDIIVNHIGQKLDFLKGGVNIAPKGKFKEMVDKYWSSLPTKIFDIIFVLGVCPIKFVPSATGDFYPDIPVWGTYRIQQMYIGELNKFIYRVLVRESDRIFKEYSTNYNFVNKARNTDNPGSQLYVGKTQISQLHEIDFTSLSSSYGSKEHNSLFSQSVPGGWMLARDIIVLNDFGMNPALDGSIMTPLRSIIGIQEYTTNLAAIMAEHNKRQLITPIFLKQTPIEHKAVTDTSGASSSSSSVAAASSVSSSTITGARKDFSDHLWNYGAINAVRLSKTPSELEQRMIRVDGVKQINQHLEESTKDIDARTNIFSYNQFGAPIPNLTEQRLVQNSVYGVSGLSGSFPIRYAAPLPEGLEMVNTAKPDASTGRAFLEVMPDFKLALCGVYQVSLDFIESKGYAQSHATLIMEMFLKTVNKWRNFGTRVLTTCYSMIYQKIDSQYSIIDYIGTNLLARDIYKSIGKHAVLEWIDNGGVVTLTKADGIKLRNMLNPKDEEQKRENQQKLRHSLATQKASIADPLGEQVLFAEPELPNMEKVQNSGVSSESDREEFENTLLSDSDYDSDQYEYDVTNGYDDDYNEDIYESEDDTDRFQKDKKVKVLKKSDLIKMDEEQIEIKVSDDQASLIDMLNHVYDNGAITTEEYWSSIRNQLGKETTKEKLKELETSLKKRIELSMMPKMIKDAPNALKPGQGQKRSSSTSSSSSKKGKKPGARNHKTEGKKQRDVKRRRANFSEANEQRKIKATKVQKKNASTGREKGRNNK